MKAHAMTITVLKIVCKSDNKRLRYLNIGSKITNMLENASQGMHIVSVHRRSFGTPHRGCAASQPVAGPLEVYVVLTLASARWGPA